MAISQREQVLTPLKKGFSNNLMGSYPTIQNNKIECCYL